MARPRATILIARHGETPWNAMGRLQGHTDIDLSDVGRAQAAALADVLAEHRPQEVWTSDLLRAKETGEIVARRLGLAAPRHEPRLRERGFGVFEGLTRGQCAEQFPEAWAAWQGRNQAPPGGEASEVAAARLGEAIDHIACSTVGTVVVVSHGGIMRLWLGARAGVTPAPIGNGETWSVALEAGALAVRRVFPPTREAR